LWSMVDCWWAGIEAPVKASSLHPLLNLLTCFQRNCHASYLR
jgi:hypothetical protein